MGHAPFRLEESERGRGHLSAIAAHSESVKPRFFNTKTRNRQQM